MGRGRARPRRPPTRKTDRVIYPATRRADTVDERHGHHLPDPYRWLEDTDAPETRTWIEAQNALTERHLAGIPARAALRSRIEALWDRPRRGVPFRRGDHWFQLRNTGLQDQDVLWTATGGPHAAPAEENAWRVLLDPNERSTDGTVSLTGLALTEDGGRLAYALSAAGSDWVTWYVRDVATGEDTGDVVPWSKFGGATWLPDGGSFLYTAYDPPGAGDEYAAVNEHQRLMRHRLGDDPADDELVHRTPDHPGWGFDATLTHDHRWLVIHVWEGTNPENRVHLAELAGDGTLGDIRPLLPDADASYRLVGAAGGRLWFHTDRDAPMGRIVALDPAAAEPADPTAWDVVLPESDERLETARLVGAFGAGDPGWLVTSTLRHASSVLTVHDLDDGHAGIGPGRELRLPELGTVADLGGGRRDVVVHHTFETLTRPTSVRRVDLRDGTDEDVFTPELAPADDDVPLVTEQVFVEHDGVRVPVFLVHREDVRPTGDVPTLLYGYGGFDISLTPMFRAPWRVWVERGGLFAFANLRGGGEYGRAWHDDGRLGNKQHVFDDAIAVAEWLQDPDRGSWSNPATTGIQGGSNGGLLVGACMTQRPDLWGACVPEVGVLDVTRFHLFTIGWAWKSDYGDPEDADDLATILTYSPLQNLRAGTCYPPTLVTTGDHDDRVVPGHSFKFAAELQHVQACDAPTLIRVDTSAGHGAGKPVSKQIDERADVVAFLTHHLGPNV
ncbi:MAG: prolyl oligopeptidase family serine peptidase [Actinobacteria bacterium]|nr:prolyl oligopeptidase family serine peptidase [Actinomycetota bacterium]